MLACLETRLLGDAKRLFNAGRYEDAKNVFVHCFEGMKSCKQSYDIVSKGAVLHNIGSCLHHMGHYDAAQARARDGRGRRGGLQGALHASASPLRASQEYYLRAMECFDSPTSVYERLVNASANRRRSDFVKKRLVDIAWERRARSLSSL